MLYRLGGVILVVCVQGRLVYVSPVHESGRIITHSDKFVTDYGIHNPRVECLWLLADPWLQNFSDISKPGLLHSVRNQVRADAKSRWSIVRRTH